MIYIEKNKSIPASCKSHGCLEILTMAVKIKASKEENSEYLNGLKENLKGVKFYLRAYNRQGVIPTFSHQIKRHLKEIDTYFETGIWKRIYSKETFPKTL